MTQPGDNSLGGLKCPGCAAVVTAVLIDDLERLFVSGPVSVLFILCPPELHFHHFENVLSASFSPGSYQ